MGDAPGGIRGVPVESTAHVVVETALHHDIQGVGGHGQQGPVAGAFVCAQRQFDTQGRRKLGRGAESTVNGVVTRLQVGPGAGQDAGQDGIVRFRGPVCRDLVALKGADRFGYPARLFDQVVPAVFPGLPQQVQHAGETGPAGQVLRREIRTGEKRFQFRCEEHRIGPTAAARDELGGRHVDLVYIRAFFAVYLDVYEMGVHDRGDIGVGEHLAFHDVAPVAGRVSDGQEDGFPLPAGAFDRLRAPGIPIHRIPGVGAQIQAGFSGQPVRGRAGSGIAALDRGPGKQDEGGEVKAGRARHAGSPRCGSPRLPARRRLP